MSSTIESTTRPATAAAGKGDMGRWIDIAALDDIPPRGARVIRTRLGCIAIFRTHDDRVFALDDRCPHKGGALSDGLVHGHAVTCPLHAWVISLEDGRVQGGGEGRVGTHMVRVAAGRILIDASLATRNAA